MILSNNFYNASYSMLLHSKKDAEILTILTMGQELLEQLTPSQLTEEIPASASLNDKNTARTAIYRAVISDINLELPTARTTNFETLNTTAQIRIMPNKEGKINNATITFTQNNTNPAHQYILEIFGGNPELHLSVGNITHNLVGEAFSQEHKSVVATKKRLSEYRVFKDFPKNPTQSKFFVFAPTVIKSQILGNLTPADAIESE